MRGLPQKIGQILSLADLEDEASPFDALPERAPAVPLGEASVWIERELGRPLDSVFASLDHRGSAASLGQVHRATLLDGRQVAVKIQFPDVAGAVDADLAALGMLARPLSAQARGFDLDAYRAELRGRLLEELDYLREADTLRRFAARAATIPNLTIPVPIDALCTPRLLTMEWVPGGPVNDTAAWATSERDAAGLALVRTFVHGCFAWAEVHADPHAGNVRFARTPSPQTGVIDFGCVKALGPADGAALRALATTDRLHPDDALALYADLGFDAARLAPIAGRLPDATAVLFEPFRVDAPVDVRAWRPGPRLAEVLGDDRWSFRLAGPASALFLIRAFHGVVAHVRALGARVSWRAALDEVPCIETRPVARPAPARLPEIPMTSHSLVVLVNRDGRQVARLSFPAGAVDHLADLVPEEHRTRIEAHGVDVAAVARDAARRGYAPGELLAATFDETSIRVWLE